MFLFRKADLNDIAECTLLFARLYQSDPLAVSQELSDFLSSDGSIVVMAFKKELCIGVAHCTLRKEYVEGTKTTPVGYLEGIFVLPQYREKGVARQLIAECEQWARQKQCREFASDCMLENRVSQAFHEKMGFQEANRIVCYRKDL